MISVWADRSDVPGHVCQDARHRDEDTNIVGYDTYRGQAGWDMGVHYRNLADLVSQLTNTDTPAHIPPGPGGTRRIQPGQIRQLAIVAHGLRGELRFDGESVPGITAENIARYRTELLQIRAFLYQDAVVFLMGCLAGQGSAGDRLLEILSGPAYWQPCTVVAFTTLGAQYSQSRSPGWVWQQIERNCTEPGMRITNDPELPFPGTHRDYSGQNLAWASQSSPHAKVARYGRIVRDADTGLNIDAWPRIGNLNLPTGPNGWGNPALDPMNGGRLPTIHRIPSSGHSHRGRGRFRRPGPGGR